MSFEAAKFAGVGILVLCFPISRPLRAQAAHAPQTTGVASIAPSSNAAEPSMQRAVVYAMVAALTPWRPIADSEPAYLEDAALPPDPAPASPQSQPKPPAGNPGVPALGDLGFPPAQTQGNLEEQARLDKRSHMLKIHQRLGLITTVPLLATVFSGGFAGTKESGSTGRNVHAALGAATAGLYFTTAYFAIFAPKIAGTPTRGPIRLHKALAWIHGSGMILTPILGIMAYNQESRGEKVHGIASAHAPVGYVTAAAFGLAILSVSVKF